MTQTDLAGLRARAAGGPWHFNPPKQPREVKLKRPHWEIGQPFGKGVGIIFGDDQSNAAFIVALVNAFDRGDLVERPEPAGGDALGDVRVSDDQLASALMIARKVPERYRGDSDVIAAAITEAREIINILTHRSHTP